MASLRSVGPGKWKATVSLGRVGGRERQKSWTFTAASKSAANRMVATWEARLHEDGRALYANPEKDRTVRAVAEAWLASIEGSPKYRTETARILKADVLPALGDTPVGRLTVAQVERYWRQMVAEGKNPSTLRAASVALTQVFELAIQYGWTMTNPVRAARRPKYRPRRINPPDIDTFHRIVDAAGPVWARLFYVAAATGMRRGEVAAMRASRLQEGVLLIDSAVSDVRGEDGAPIVKGPKTESGIRDIWLTEETQLQLMGQLEFIRDRARRVRVPLVDDPFLWSFSPTCGVPPTPSSITHAFGATCKRAGVVGVRFHDLRHMYATLGIKAGKAITTLSRQLGHSNPRTTLAIYSHWEKQALAEVSDWVDDVLRPKTPELEAGE